MLTIVIPVYNEGENIKTAIERIEKEVKYPHIINIIYDFDEDTTVNPVKEIINDYITEIYLVKNKYGRGVLNAIKTGLETFNSEYAVVTMADLSDPPSVINEMIDTAEKNNADIVCASRYMKGGSQSGGPVIKSLMSRAAGMSLYYMAGLPVHDATNSFKLYRKSFLDKMTIESKGGFELGIELVAKAFKGGYKLSEVPTSWEDRVAGESNFKLLEWLPNYLKWYFYAFNKEVLLKYMCVGILALFAFYNLYQVWTNAVDLPYWDEWDTYLSSCVLKDKLDINWLFSHWNEHKIVFTKFLTWLQYRIDGWNIAHQIKFNFFIQIASLAVLYKLLRSTAKSFALLPLFFIPYFSDIIYENALWGFQSQFYIMTLFCFLAIYFGYVKESNIKNNILFTFFTICAMFSQTFAAGIALIIPYIIKERRNLKYILCSLIPLLGAFAVFFTGKIDVQVSHLYFPNTLTFWYYFSHTIFKSITGISIAKNAELFIILFLLALYTYLLFIKNKLDDKKYQIYTALIFLACTFLSAITVGRAEYGYIISPRYYNVTLFLIPVISVMLYNYKKYRYVSVYLLILIMTFYNCFSFNDYKISAENRLFALKILELYKGQKSFIIGTIYPDNLNDKIDNAKVLNISFIRKINAK